MKNKFFLLAMLLSFFIGQPRNSYAQCPDGATQCAVTIVCGDVYGDGWNGAAIKVWQGTTLRGTATLASGNYGEVEINICSGDSVRFEWQSGQLDNEVYFGIANGDGTVVVSGIFGSDLHNGQTIATIWPTCPSCIRPQNLSATADSTSALISWTPMGSESSWLVSIDGGAALVVNAPYHTFFNLAQSSHHDVSIRALCGAGDTSDAAHISFRTACEPIAIPYFNNFDNEEPGDIPHCWNGVAMFGDMPKVYDEMAYSDSLALLFGATHGYNIVATPLVPLPGNEIAVNFQGFIENGLVIGDYSLINSWLQAGVMSDLSDTSTFISLVNVDTMDNNWHEYEFNTSSLPADQQYYVAFRFYGDDLMWGNAAVDDISITHYNGCDRPLLTFVDSVGSNAALISWNNACDNATGYAIYINTDNNPQTSSYFTTVQDTFCIVDSLLQSTTYYAWVRTECDSVYADYKAVQPFTTGLSCATVSDLQLYNVSHTAAALTWHYDTYYGFPSVGAQAMLYDLTDLTQMLQSTYTTSDNAHFTGLLPGHAYRVYIRNTCQIGDNVDTANAVWIDFMTESCSSVEDQNNYSSSEYLVGTSMTHSYTQSIYTRAEMPAVDTIYGVAFRTGSDVAQALTFDLYIGNTSLAALSANAYVPLSNLTLMASSYTVPTSAAGWHIIPFATPFVYDTNQNLVIATHNHSGVFYLNPISWRYHSTGAIQTFQWNNFGAVDPAAPSSYFTGSSYGAADVRFITNCTVSGCLPPFICRADADSTSISVTWVAEGDDNPFVVQYRSAYTTAYQTAYSPLYDTTCTITGLNPATSYSIRVGTICDGDTLWNYVNQTTNCGPLATPYSEDFDSYAERVMPPCWTYNPERVDHLYGGISYNAQYATHSPSTRAAVLPPLAADLYTLEINFRARLGDASQGNGILIGVADNNGENISWLDTLTVANQSMDDYRWFNYSFADYDGDGGRIALSFLAPYNTLYGVSAIIDDITVSTISSCPAVTEFAISNISDASAVTVSWNNPAQASQFQIAWDTIGTPLPLAANTATVADTFYTLPQLVSGAKYSFYVSAVCPDEQSTWRSIDFAAGTIIMRTNSDTTVTGCGLAIYDNGGPAGIYSSSSVSKLVVYPSGQGNTVTFRGGTIDLSQWSNDALYIYEGDTTGGTPLFSCTYTGGTMTIDTLIVSELGPMTFLFVTDFYDVAAGYELFTGCAPLPSCLRPRNVTVSAVSANSAQVSWTGSALSYNVFYREQGVGSWTALSSPSNSITITGLAESSTYEVKVQGVCNGGDLSEMSTVVLFTTTCVPVTITPSTPIEEDFESPTAPANCFTMVYADPNPTNLMQHDQSAAWSGTRSFSFSSYHSSSNYRQTLISPAFSANDSIRLRFRYSDIMFGNETMRVGYSNTGNSPQDFVWTDTIVTAGTPWLLYENDFPPTAHYVAIDYLSVFRYNAYIDSLKISVVPTADCQTPTIVNIDEGPVSITVQLSGVSNLEVCITDGAWSDGLNGTVVGNVDEYTFDGLTPNTQYTIGFRNRCSNGLQSEWVVRNVRTATVGCPAPEGFVVNDASYRSATFDWNADGEASIWEINVFNTAFNQTYTTTEHPFTVEGLAQDVGYSAKIRSVCYGAPGQWSPTVSFHTQKCNPVTNITYETTSHNGYTEVTLRWEGDAESYELQYGPEHFSVGMGTTVTGITATEYHIDSIPSDASYDIFIRSHCAAGVTSNWSQAVTIRPVGIDVTDDAIGFEVYPNPATDHITVSLTGAHGEVHLLMTDLNGRMMRDISFVCDGDCGRQIELGAFPKGVYFIRVSTQSDASVRKVVIR